MWSKPAPKCSLISCWARIPRLPPGRSASTLSSNFSSGATASATRLTAVATARVVSGRRIASRVSRSMPKAKTWSRGSLSRLRWCSSLQPIIDGTSSSTATKQNRIPVPTISPIW